MTNRLLLLSAIFSLIALATKAQVAKPTMGWSSWNTFSVNISEDIIKGQADAMVSQGLADVGYEYINIDDGFQFGRKSDGNVRIHPQRFPNGLKVVSDYIHSKGLKAGIYSDAGDCTCGSIGQGETYNSNVGLYGHETQDAQFYFNECEFDFIKVDYCGGIHLGIDEQDQYTRISNAIKATGRDVRYNLCRWAYPGNWCHDISTSWRTTGDIYDGWESVRGILAENLYLSAYCYDGCYNDMDMLEVGRSMSKEEDRTHFGMWCIMASPLLIGCNMATIRPDALELLKNTELIALNQDPLGLQAYVVKRVGDTYILVKDVETLYGNTRAVALYNPTDDDVSMALCFDDVDLGGSVQVRDLFNHEDLGTKHGAIYVDVPAHGTRIYRLQGEERLERYRYEGEQAYLGCYQEIKNNESEGTAIYIGANSASGGVYAGWLGGRAENDLQWRNVYSKDGGDYTVTFACGSQDSRSFVLEVNGQTITTITVSSGAWEKFQDYTATVSLNAGENTIRLYNTSKWMPNIDCMLIEKVGTQIIVDRRLQSACATLQAKATNDRLPSALKESIATLLDNAVNADEADKVQLLAQVEGMIDTVDRIAAICTDFDRWKFYAEKNIAASQQTDALTTLTDKVYPAYDAFDASTTFADANRAASALKTALRSYLRNEKALPRPGEELDMTLLVVNFDFSETSGWQGSPTYRSGCGEEYDKTFDMYQSLASMRPGIYTIGCNALYRTTHNDGGAEYRAGRETIPALFYVNEQSQPILSLYSYHWPEAADYGGIDNLNGFPHSMRAAGIVFAQGAYQNEITYSLAKKGSLRIGLKCDAHKPGCWCCFDNFYVTFRPFDDADGIASVQTATTPEQDTFDLQGRPVDSPASGIYIRHGNKVVIK